MKKKETKNKYKTKNIILSSAVVILSIFCISNIIYIFFGGYYSSRVSTFDTVIGQPKNIEINGVGSYSAALNFSGNILLDDIISQEITASTNSISSDLNLRAKAEISNFNDTQTILFGYTNWVNNLDDNYIYLNQIIKPNQKIGICKYVKLNKNLKLKSDKNYTLLITIEAYTQNN